MKPLLTYFRKLILEGPTEYWTYANQWWDARMQKKRVKRAIRIAQKLVDADKRKRYIIKTPDGTLTVVTKVQIRLMRKKNILSKGCNHFEISKDVIQEVTFKGRNLTHTGKKAPLSKPKKQTSKA